jgi:CRISPR/Cas system-associated exonuclease Cas4 (RecB family)
VVHEAIAEQVGEWRVRNSTSLVDAKKSAEEGMIQVWEEFHSDEDVTPEREKMISICKRHLTNVFRHIWPRYQDHTYISHEQSATFPIDGYPVTVKLDLCLRTTDGKLRIVDWKTGVPDRRADVHPQLMTYALWASEHLEPDLSNIIVEFVSTRDAGFDKALPKKAQVDSIRAQIVEESRLWSESTAIEEYPPNPSEKLCRSCEYLERCDAGREVVG